MNSSILDNSEVNIKSILRKTKKEDFELKSIYFLEKDKFSKYLYNKFSFNYAKEMSNTTSKIFTRENCKNARDILEVIESKKLNPRSVKNSYRVFINFLESKELVNDETILKLRNKINIKN